MIFRQLFDADTSTYTYILGDAQSKDAVIIDPVRERVERDLQVLRELKLRLLFTLDTHVHADHVTAAALLREATDAQVVMARAGGAMGADRYVDNHDSIRFGTEALEVRSTPGHTDGCITFVTADRTMAFTGDALLIRGSGRTDFQQGDARKLFHSVHDNILSLPDEALLYPGHDYQGRTVSTVAEEKAFNKRLGDGKTVQQFVEIMENLNLPYPKRIDVSVPANMRCGGIASDSDNTDTEASHEVIDTALADWTQVKRSVTGIPEVELTWLHSAGSAVRLVDVRQPHEFTGALGHLDGAELVPLDKLTHEARQWQRSQEIVLICHSGGRSGAAALELERLGFRNVASLAGGMLNVAKTQRTAQALVA